FGGNVTSGAVGLAGELIVTVNRPGVANVARIGHSELFDTSLASLLDFAETLCGWTITPLGIEARVTSAATAAGDTRPAMQAFRACFDAVSPARASFAGCPASIREQSLGIAQASPAYVAQLAVDLRPGHPLGWLRLAEGAASGDPQQLRPLLQRLHLAGLDELNALARAWCAHAARLAGDVPDLMQRVADAETALTKRDEGFW